MCSGDGGESAVQFTIDIEMEDLLKPDVLPATLSCGAACAWSAASSALNVSELLITLEDFRMHRGVG